MSKINAFLRVLNQKVKTCCFFMDNLNMTAHMLVSFSNNTTGVASGAGTANLSGISVISGVCIVHSLVFCVMFCRSLFAVLSHFFVPLYTHGSKGFPH